MRLNNYLLCFLQLALFLSFAPTSLAGSETMDSKTRTIHMMQSLDVLLWEDFEGSFDIPENWLAVDNNGDGHNWRISFAGPGDNPFRAAESRSLNADESGTPTPIEPDNWLITPQLNVPENVYGLTYQRQSNNALTPAENYEVLVSTTGSDIADFDQMVFSETLNEGEVWEDIFVRLDDFAGEDIFIAFRHYDCVGQGSLYLNNIKVYQLPAYDMFVEKKTDDMHVGAGEQASYQVNIQNRGLQDDTFDFDKLTGDWYSLSEQSVQLASGEMTTVYVDVNVPEDVQMGDTDDLLLTVTSQGNPEQSETVEVTTTAVTAVSADYLEDFSNVSVPELPLGWRKIVESTDQFSRLETNSFMYYSEPNSVVFNNADDTQALLVLVSPEIENDLNDLRVSFYAKKQQATSFPILKVGTISDPNDPATFNELDAFYFTDQFEPFTISLEDYQGDDKYIAFKHDSSDDHYASVFLDHIFIEESKPFDVQVENLSGDMAVQAGQTGVYDIEVTNNGFEDDIYSILLDANRNWEYDMDESLELSAGQSTVAQLTVTVPQDAQLGELLVLNLEVVSQSQDDVNAELEVTTTALNTISDFPYTEGFEEDFPPLGWSKVSTYEEASWSQSQMQSYSGSFSANASTAMIFRMMDYVADEWLISPCFDFDHEEAEDLLFFGKSQNAPNGVIEMVRVYALEHQGDKVADLIDQGILVEEVQLTEEWASYLVDLSHLEGEKHIAIHYEINQEDDGEHNNIYIDDFSIGAFNSFELTMEEPEGEGTVSPQAGEYSFVENEQVNLQAIAATGWYFDHWVGNVENVNEEETTVVMTADQTVKAVFSPMEVEALPFHEDFSEIQDGSIPHNWMRTHENWAVTNTDEAGGQSPEMQLSPLPMSSGEVRLISPPLDFSTTTEAEMTFQTHIEDSQWAGYTLTVQTSVDGETWENTSWEHDASDKQGKEDGPQTIVIDLEHLDGQEQVFVSWVLIGMTMDLNLWAIDNISIEGVPEEVFYTVMFDILDDDTNPVEDAVVTLGEITNPSGDYTFTDIEPGNYTYTIEAEGFFPVTEHSLEVDEDTTVSVTMETDDVFVDKLKSKVFSVYPNPSTGILHIDADEFVSQVALLDIGGNTVKTVQVDGHRTTLNLQDIPSGIYLLKITGDNVSVTQRVIVSH